MRVLVTGANGYVGREVVAALDASGHSPVAMVRAAGATVAGATELRLADLLDVHALRQAMEGVDVVCHLAGVARARESLTEPLKYFRVNTAGTIALLDAMARAEVKKIVLASTGSIYGTPKSQPMVEDMPDAPPHPYASSKLAAELAVEAQARGAEISAITVRMLNVAGGLDPDPTRLVPRVLATAMGQGPLPVNGQGTAVRDYLHVADAAAAFVACVEHLPAMGKSTRYNIGSGVGYSVLDVVAAAERVTGRQIPLEHRPPVSEPEALVSDPAKAMSELNWSPERSSIAEIVRDAWSAVSEAQ